MLSIVGKSKILLLPGDMSDGDNSFPSVSKYQEVISAILKEGSHNIINIKDSNNT